MNILKKMRKLVKGQEEDAKPTRKWAEDLPEDIMRFISEKLFFTDQARFLAIFRGRRWIHNKRVGCPLPRPRKQLPWLFSARLQSNEEGSPMVLSFKLYDPVYEKTYTIQDTSLLKDVHIQDLNDPNFTVWGSMEGWLLISITEIKPHKCYDLVFYNPFTGEKKKLPYSDSPFDSADFSSSPSSSECTVFVVHCNYDKDLWVSTTHVSACRLSDKTWTTISFMDDYVTVVHDLVYLDRTLYWMMMNEGYPRVASFDISKNARSMDDFPQELWNYGDQSNECITTLMKSDCEILMVCKVIHVEDDTKDFCIFKLVNGGPNWVQVHSLGNQALFVATSLEGYRFTDATEVSETAAGGLTGNGIYDMEVPYSYFYCLKNKSSTLRHTYPSLEEKEKLLIQGFVEPPILHY